MDCKQTKLRQKKNKNTTTDTQTTKENKTKSPPSTHACTYTFWNISVVMKATVNTTYLNTSLMAWGESNHQK